MPPKAKPDTAAYQKLKKDIKEGTIGTLYVFHGEEAYLRDFYLGQLKKKLLPAGMEEFNLHTLSGKEFDVKTLAQLVDCLPMMSERTLIVVNDYDIYKGDKDALAAVLRELPDYVCLVFVYDLIEYKADARTKLAALLKEKGSVVPFNRQGQGDLVDWISRRFKAMDHDIGTEDAKYLIFLCGDLMNNLISEIGKIGSYAAHHRVTRQDIDAVATPQLDAVVFQMTDAIAAGNFDKAAEVLGSCSTCRRPPSSCWRCWASSSASSTPPAWPSSTERACPTSWSCGACARPTRRSGSCSPPGAFPCPGAAGRCSAAARPIWP